MAKQYVNISTNQTLVIKQVPGVLGHVVINTKGASANVLTLYDNTAASGTVIAVIDTTDSTPREYNLSLQKGLTAVLATGTAADVTITFE